MKSYKQIQKTLTENYSFSSVQVKMPEVVSARIMNFQEKICINEFYNDYSEERPHITIKYGIHSGDISCLDDIKELFPKNIVLELGNTSMFSNTDNEVLKIDVESEYLIKMNKIITDNIECTTTFPIYIPHCTIAYLKHGNSYKYIDDDMFRGIYLCLDEIEFSSKDNNVYQVIKL